MTFNRSAVSAQLYICMIWRLYSYNGRYKHTTNHIMQQHHSSPKDTPDMSCRYMHEHTDSAPFRIGHVVVPAVESLIPEAANCKQTRHQATACKGMTVTSGVVNNHAYNSQFNRDITLMHKLLCCGQSFVSSCISMEKSCNEQFVTS